MSTIILLSSSPPPVFARSPTPADLSSPFPTAAAILHDQSPGRNRFKAKLSARDGFPAFSTARQVLKDKCGAENQKIGSPGRYRFRSSQDDKVEERTDEEQATGLPTSRNPSNANTFTSDAVLQPTRQKNPAKTADIAILEAEAGRQGKQKDTSSEPLFLERAATRKTDWTPPKPQIKRQDEEKPVEYSAGFMNGMLRSFTYPEGSTKPEKLRIAPVPNPAKRRRVESSSKTNAETSVATISKVGKVHSAPPKNISTRIRSPKKKALTITGLATSAYSGKDETSESPLVQYLTSSQAQLEDTSTELGLESKVQRTKDAVKRMKESRKGQFKTSLLSPESAMKTYDNQEAIFGSASQLARDESPTFLRETIEAIKESESFLMSDPFSSPQRTQPVSVDNTPNAGTSRFRKTRNLWAAAGRDEDNALLHVDMIDLTNTPAIRNAFAGKDVMLQPEASRVMSSHTPGVPRHGGCSLLSRHETRVVDIDTIAMTSPISTRAFSTAYDVTDSRELVQSAPQNLDTATTSKETEVSQQPKTPPPPKPNYAGFTVPELNKQIKAYGFKAMRKREKMIELLDRCWEEKYGPSGFEGAIPAAAPYGDFLSEVHDVAARPEPKVKKPRFRKKKEGETEPKEKPPKVPRQRKPKKAEDGESGAQVKPKAPRKRKPKPTDMNDDSVADIDKIWAEVPQELKALEAFDDWARPERKPKAKTKSQPLTNELPADAIRMPMPSASIPLATISASAPAFDEQPRHSKPQCQPTHSSMDVTSPSVDHDPQPTPTSSLPPIADKITSAIHNQSQSTTSNPMRNFNTHPTWQQKILLYDPIILEDLAAWLNTEGFNAIGEDREVSALEVREWCEERGVCCLWKGGWRGNKAAQQ